jgi:hypothetical protein
MKEPVGLPKKDADGTQVDKEKAVTEPKSMLKQSKAAALAEERESSKQAEIRGTSGKVPYCYRCKTKDHAIEVCHATMYCDICAS